MPETLVCNIALVSESARLPFDYVVTCAAALNKQMQRDVDPLWGTRSTVQAYEKLRHAPSDYWPVVFRDDIDNPGALGYHSDRNGQPYALCSVTAGWTTTASHEVIEMALDPFGNRFIGGAHPTREGRRVNYLVEASDPSEAFSYRVNGVKVSDFYTPRYFDPELDATGATKYSFMGVIKRPRQVLKGGYLSFYEIGRAHV